MRPKITCHMITSLDGRLFPSRWSDPVEATVDDLVDLHYDATAARLDADGWLVGRKTMAEYVEQDDAPTLLDAPRVRPPHVADAAPESVAVAVDPMGRLVYEKGDLDGDHLIAVVSERVTDAYLERLRAAGVSYVFAGPDGRQPTLALTQLGAVFGLRHLLLEGGGRINGAFLAAGLIDAVSTLICPAIDGLAGVPAIFEHTGPKGGHPAAGQALRLTDCEALDGGVVWLRHEVVRR